MKRFRIPGLRSAMEPSWEGQYFVSEIMRLVTVKVKRDVNDRTGSIVHNYI